MKRINKYILEKLHINKDVKVINDIDNMSIEEFMKQYGCEINKERQAKAIADSVFYYSKYDKVFHKSNIFIKTFEKIYDNLGDIENRINKDLKDILGEYYVILKKYGTYGHMTISISNGKRKKIHCHLGIENNIWLTHYDINIYNFDINITIYDNIMKHVIKYLINKYGQ